MRSIISLLWPGFRTGLVLAVGLGSITASTAAAESPWSFQLGGGVTSRYAYRTTSYWSGTYHDRFDATWDAFSGVSRHLGDHFAAMSEIGYTRFEAPLNVGSAYGNIDSRLRAQYFSLGVGVRYYPGPPTEARPRPYLQFLPTVFHSRWRERNEYTQLIPTVSPAVTTEHSSSHLDPGFEAGVGLAGPLAGPLKLDLGARYRYSKDIGQQKLYFGSGDFNGLRQFDFVISIAFVK